MGHTHPYRYPLQTGIANSIRISDRTSYCSHPYDSDTMSQPFYLYELRPFFHSIHCLASPSNDVLNRIYSWPAHGDVSQYQDYYLAPYKDVDSDGKYDPMKGDYPWYDDILGRDDIKCGSDRRISLFGDETHW